MKTWIDKMKVEGLYCPPQFVTLLREWAALEYEGFSEDNDEEKDETLLNHHRNFIWKLLDLLGRCYVACGIRISYPTEFESLSPSSKLITPTSMPDEARGVI